MMYLLDTNVVSALRRPDRHPAPTLWLKDQRASDVYINMASPSLHATSDTSRPTGVNVFNPFADPDHNG